MIDLHTHSTASDGSDDPEIVAELARAAGCSAWALTDHDTLEGVVPAAERSASLGLTFVPGCELSCEWASGTMHLLVYFVEPGDGPLQEELVRLQAVRRARNEAMARRLAEIGLPITYEELLVEAGGRGVGRPHAAGVLVRKGVVASIQEAFDAYLAKGKPGYVEKERLSPGRAIGLARASRGVAVLAHPLSLRVPDDQIGSTLRDLARLGLSGVECIYGRYDGATRDRLAEVASDEGLVVTGGSDHHGTYKPDLSVGAGRGDLSVADETIGLLHARRP